MVSSRLPPAAKKTRPKSNDRAKKEPPETGGF
jgi:hypothetical protein